MPSLIISFASSCNVEAYMALFFLSIVFVSYYLFCMVALQGCILF